MELDALNNRGQQRSRKELAMIGLRLSCQHSEHHDRKKDPLCWSISKGHAASQRTWVGDDLGDPSADSQKTIIESIRRVSL